MEVRRITSQSLTGEDLDRMLSMSLLPGSAQRYRTLMSLLNRDTVYGIYADETLAAYAAASMHCTYLPKAVVVHNFCYGWEYNREPEIRRLLIAFAGSMNQMGYENIILEIDCLHDLNQQLYRTMGFEDLLFHSPNGPRKVLIAAPAEKMIGFDT